VALVAEGPERPTLGFPSARESLQCGRNLGAAAVPGKIEGKIAAYGPSGNLVTDIPHERLKSVPPSDGVKVACDEHETIGIYPANHQEEPSTFMAILGDSGCLELTIVGDSAKAMLGVSLGEKVVVKW
jgi:S-adenosylmethionine hydrolase